MFLPATPVPSNAQRVKRYYNLNRSRLKAYSWLITELYWAEQSPQLWLFPTRRRLDRALIRWASRAVGPVSLWARWCEFRHFCYAIAGRSWGEENKTKATMLCAYLSLKLETDFWKLRVEFLKTILEGKGHTGSSFARVWLTGHSVSMAGIFFLSSHPSLPFFYLSEKFR